MHKKRVQIFIGMVLDGSVDFALDAFGITKVRMGVADYLQMGQGGKGRIYIRNPRETFDWEIYTKPFRKITWISVLTFCIIVPVIMVIVMVDCKFTLNQNFLQKS